MYTVVINVKHSLFKMKIYRKIATVRAKLFEHGDEDGFIGDIPYVQTLENPAHFGEFGKQYVCTGIKGERWLVEKDIFESTYEEIKQEIEKL
jgi:hypothetical protein